MKFYASFFNYNLKKVPIIVAEVEYETSPGFEDTISNLYITILQNCRYIILPPTQAPAESKEAKESIITIYNATGEARRPEFIFKVKKEFTDGIENELFFELHIYVTNGYIGDILEKHYLNTVLYKNRFCREVVYNDRPVFNIINDQGRSLLKNAKNN